MSNPLWIRGGRIIDPDVDRDEEADLFAIDGVIAENLSEDQRSSAQVIDAKGKIVCPGFICTPTSASLDRPKKKLSVADHEQRRRVDTPQWSSCRT